MIARNPNYIKYKHLYKKYSIEHREERIRINRERRNKLLYGGLREQVYERDNYKCVKCGMTNEEHHKKWNMDLTIDHIDGEGKWDIKGGKRNTLNNLQTLCFRCHGVKSGKKSWDLEKKKTGGIRINRRGINSPLYKHGLYITKENLCLQCKKSFISSSDKFCSRNCYYDNMRFSII